MLTSVAPESEIALFYSILGPLGSGKTTLMRLMHIMENGGYSEQQKMKFITPIRENIVYAARQLVAAMKQLEIPYELELPEGTVDTLLSMYSLPEQGFTEELQAMVAAIWRDNGVQACLERHEDFELAESAK